MVDVIKVSVSCPSSQSEPFNWLTFVPDLKYWIRLSVYLHSLLLEGSDPASAPKSCPSTYNTASDAI